MTTESDDYHSTTELECFMQDAHDSDVEITTFDKDGVLLSGISEYDSSPIEEEPIDYDNNYNNYNNNNISDLYYILHDRKSHYNKNNPSHKNIKYLLKNICEAPHLYIQQRTANSDSLLCSFINYILFKKLLICQN
eukprot:14671_1